MANACTDQSHQWEVLEVRLSIDEPPANPFDLKLTGSFHHASGRLLEISGFYDGGGEFVFRFTPPTAGSWTYETDCSLPALDGISGTVEVAAPREGRRGGIIVDPNRPTHFSYQNGDSYFPIAFESDWLFALDADNPRDIPNTRKLVDWLADNGFNQIVMNVFAYDVDWDKDGRLQARHDFGRPRAFPFAGSNDQPDHTQLNVEYFQRLDRVIEYLDQKGIVAHLMIYVWNKQVHWPEAGSAADNRYFDYVVKRYQAYPNLVWDVSKEALGYGHNDVNYITERIERLRSLDAYDRLITVHAYGYCRRFPEQVDFVSVQLWVSELYGAMRRVCGEFPEKPILNIEHGGYERGPYVVFEGNYTSPEVCLERAWQCVFAGSFPTHYWQGAAWNVVITDPSELAKADRPRFDYYRHLRRFVDKYQVGNLTVGQQRSNAGFCLHNDDLYLFYVPKECEYVGVRLPQSLRGGSMRGTWFNPFDGTFGEPEKQTITQWPRFEVPSEKGFRILIVEVVMPSSDAAQDDQTP